MQIFMVMLLILLPINTLFVFIFIDLYKMQVSRWLKRLLLIILVVNLSTSVYIGVSSFPLNMMILLGYLGVAFLSFLTLVLCHRRVKPVVNSVYWVNGLVIVVMQSVLPWMGFWVTQHSCRAVTTHRVERIVFAMEQYHQDQGMYPDQLEFLVPTYLQKVPSPMCGAREFDVFRCLSQDQVIAYPAYGGFGIERYNLTTKQWSSVDTFDFDRCDYLE